MFKRSQHRSMDRAGKATRPSKRSFREDAVAKMQQAVDSSPSMVSSLTSPIITMVVGPHQRLFACHQDVLALSPFFATALRGQYYESFARRIELPDEVPEVFSSILEFLYKGDYYPRLLHDKKRNTYALEDAALSGTMTHASTPTLHDENHGRGSVDATVYHPGAGGILLKDTAVYCAADKFGLDALKRLALRKQGLHAGISVDVILRSARFAYANTPDSDAKLRAHFLALIIRSRKTFKRSGTMQMEMEIGGSKLFFDLFVAMCNHIDDVADLTSASKRASKDL